MQKVFIFLSKFLIVSREYWKAHNAHPANCPKPSSTKYKEDYFECTIEMAYPKVHAFSLGFTKNEADAADIAQLVFMKLWVKRNMLANVQNFDTYLYTITKNTTLNHIASRKTFSVDIATVREMAAGNASPQELVEADDLQLLIDMVVDNMPSQRQAIYRMSREEGLSNEQIAEKMGLQKKTVENHINLALRDIREMLKILILLLTTWV